MQNSLLFLHRTAMIWREGRPGKLHGAGENPSTGSAVRHKEREEGSGIRGGGEEGGTA